MAASSRLDRAPLSERLPGTWKLVSRIDVVTADCQRSIRARHSVRIRSPFSSTIARATFLRSS